MLHDDSRVDALGNQQRGAAVPEIVKAGSVGQTSFLEEALELPHQVARLDRLAERGREHQTVILPGIVGLFTLARLRRPVALQQGQEGWRERKGRILASILVVAARTSVPWTRWSDPVMRTVALPKSTSDQSRPSTSLRRRPSERATR
jgi:hypothetical protein